ncbi:MAG: YciI family protein [Hyphomicrobiaceae bacterium]|nr:hypothetical protein [Hyphomicrobiaceae bacterium]
MADHSPHLKALWDKMLRKRLWVVITTAVAPREEIEKVLEAHLVHQIRLEKEGIMFGAGPLSTADGSPTGTGMIIIRAESEAEARRIADQDPFHAKGLRTYTLQQWSLNEGRITLTIDYSDQSYRLT